jgi:lipid II:glycine glycyltransferase (peptidoglycan interpeptide bridge formation enzyme)
VTASASPTTLDVSRLRDDPRAWDAFVAAAPTGSFPQLDAWARASRARGWRMRRVVTETPSGPIGLQLLIHRMAPTPFGRGYAPRGPVAMTLDAEGIAALTVEVRRVGSAARLAHVVIDPAVPRGHDLEGWLRREGWQPVPPRQVNSTRLVDLTRPVDALWSDLRSGTKWSVNKARRNGVEVVDVGAAGLPEVEPMYHETARRVGFAPGSFSGVVRAFIEDGDTRVVVARTGAGTPLAAAVLVPCGERVIEVYGVASDEGGRQQAGHLLKWEALRSSQERGFATFDMWGADDPGIAWYKAGFGGYEVEYVGAWALVTHSVAEGALGMARAARGLLRRRSPAPAIQDETEAPGPAKAAEGRGDAPEEPAAEGEPKSGGAQPKTGAEAGGEPERAS